MFERTVFKEGDGEDHQFSCKILFSILNLQGQPCDLGFEGESCFICYFCALGGMSSWPGTLLSPQPTGFSSSDTSRSPHCLGLIKAL